jgi:hypothetical protein
MTTISIQSAKLNAVFKAGSLPRIDPNSPEFIIDLGGFQILARVNAKAARKLAIHQGGAVLQGRLVVEHGKPVLLEGGFQWIDPKPVEVTTP